MEGVFTKLVVREEQDPEEGYLDQELFESLSRKDIMDIEGNFVPESKYPVRLTNRRRTRIIVIQQGGFMILLLLIFDFNSPCGIGED
jgi:hypothetical protein